ncbi:type II toxin-antitoxin system prevent-host-death family antitoxin [Streptomyces sp. BBFR109]|uniref:type II toxin-antitoxin system prevent-host-death family antitoxin n=1 Tax=Streptomyces sp. BBFR109 TaxID=3448172 RepID=UPI003F75C3A1
MATHRTEHRAKIAEARNVLGEVISRARYADEPTILINRGKEAAVIVSHPFYEQALRDRALIEALEQRAEEPAPEAKADAKNKARVLREALDMAARTVVDAVRHTD